MWRRWFIFTVVAPVLAFANAGCLFGGADVFIADAVVQATGTTTPPGLVYIRFKYDVRDGKMRIRGHFKDAGGLSASGKGVFLKFQGVIDNAPTSGTGVTPCMGAIVHYIAEDPNHEYYDDIVDLFGLPLLPNEGTLALDACDNSHDPNSSVGDTLDLFQVIDGPFAPYQISGVVVDGKFECKSPDPCSAPI